MKNKKNSSELNVAILDGQTVQAMAIAEYLYFNKHNVTLLCDKKASYGYYSRFASSRLLCPKITDSREKYKEFLLKFLSNNKIDVIIPSNDDSASFMSFYKKELLKYTNFIMPDYDVFIKGYDKNLLMNLCREKGYPHPRTADLSVVSLKEGFEYVGVPAILKPNLTSGGRGMHIINSFEDLEFHYAKVFDGFGFCHLQQYIPSGGGQFKVQLFKEEGKQDAIYTIMHKIRYYPEKGGSSCCNVSINDTKLYETCNSILNDLGWVGFADFDLIEDPTDGQKKVMEINPRVPACIKTSLVSGVDFANIIVNASVSRPLPEVNYKTGKYLRYFGLDLLWFYYSKNRLKARPSWFNFFGRNVFYQDGTITDPMPFIVGTFGGFIKQLNPKFRKAKSGLI